MGQGGQELQLDTVTHTLGKQTIIIITIINITIIRIIIRIIIISIINRVRVVRRRR